MLRLVDTATCPGVHFCTLLRQILDYFSASVPVARTTKALAFALTKAGLG